MGTVAKNTGKDFPKAPAGTHIARCFEVIDLGHQKITFKGVEKWAPKIILTWELCNEMMGDSLPFTVSARLTLSLAETSMLRPMLESWRGKPFTTEELNGFDVRKVVGAYCMLGIVHNTVEGKTYANVTTAMALPKGTTKPAPINPTFYFGIETGDIETLPEWLQKVVRVSQEYTGEDADPMQKISEMEDDIPF